MTSYEGVVVMKPSLDIKGQQQILLKSKDAISEHGGELNHCDTWGTIDLANPVKNITNGIFFHYTFNGKDNVVKEIERLYKLNSNVIKYMHINLGKGTDLKNHVEEYKSRLTKSVQTEKEREQKRKEKKKFY